MLNARNDDEVCFLACGVETMYACKDHSYPYMEFSNINSSGSVCFTLCKHPRKLPAPSLSD